MDKITLGWHLFITSPFLGKGIIGIIATLVIAFLTKYRGCSLSMICVKLVSIIILLVAAINIIFVPYVESLEMGLMAFVIWSLTVKILKYISMNEKKQWTVLMWSKKINKREIFYLSLYILLFLYWISTIYNAVQQYN